MEKLFLDQTEIQHLGLLLTHEGIRLMKNHIEYKNMRSPTTNKGVHTYI